MKYRLIIIFVIIQFKSLIGQDYSIFDTVSPYQVLVDSSIKYGYGYFGFMGKPSIGKIAIKDIVYSHDKIDTLNTLLKFSNNKVGKIYIIQTLLLLSSEKKIILEEKDKDLIRSIVSENYEFLYSRGCVGEYISTLEFFNNKPYSKYLKKNKIKVTKNKKAKK